VTPLGTEPATFRPAADYLYLHLYQRKTHVFTGFVVTSDNHVTEQKFYFPVNFTPQGLKFIRLS